MGIQFSGGAGEFFELLERRELFSTTALPTPAPAAGAVVPVIEAPAGQLHAADAAAGTGLTAQYFSDTNFANATLVRIDSSLSLKGSAKDKITKTSGSVLWTGTLVPSYSEAYTFTTVTKGGAQLIVNGQTIIDQLQGSGGTIAGSSTVTLTAGQHYDISFSYVRRGTASAKLMWSSPSQALGVIPTSALYPAAVQPTLPVVTGTVVGQYYTGQNFDNLVMTRSDPNINFNFGPNSPISSNIPANTPFSIRWTGQIMPAKTGVYTLSSKSDDGIRVWINGQLVIDNYHDQAAAKISKGTISLTAGTAYSLRVDYYQNGQGVGSVKLQYSLGSKKGMNNIPSNYFVPPATGTAGVLSATSVSASEVDLGWTGSSTATGYEVDRQDSEGNWQQIGTTDPSATTFSDTGLSPATAYEYRVEPLGSTNAFTQSNVLQANTLTESPGGASVTAATAGEVDLRWGDVTGETGFIILDSTDGGQTFSPVGTTGQGVLSYSVTGLVPGTDYQFEVESLNVNGLPSAPSAAVDQVTPTIPPTAVSALSASSSGATVLWNDVPGGTGFVVERSTTGTSGWATVATLGAGTITYNDTGLAGGTAYFYRVSTLNAGGASAPSLPAATLTIPSLPSISVAGVSSALSQVAWQAVTGATQYVVQRSADGLTNWTTVATAAGNATSATITNAANSTQFFYRVMAGNAAGTSAPSSTASAYTAPTVANALLTTIFGAVSDGGVYAINMSAGTSAKVGQLPAGAFGIERNPLDGKVYYSVANGSAPTTFGTWDPTTGNNTVLTNVLPNANRGTFASDGTTYVTNTSGQLYVFSPSGVQTLIGQMKILSVSQTMNGAGNLSIDSSGNLWLANNGAIYQVNKTTAALTPVVTLGLGNVSITFGDNGQLFFTTANGGIYSLNLITLVPNLLNMGVANFNSLTANPQWENLSLSGSATLTHGSTGVYNLTLNNAGPAAEPSPTTVTVTLPTGVTFTGITGTGWTATASGQTVTLTYTGAIAASGSSPTAHLNVNVSSSTSGIVTSNFTLNGQLFDMNTLNDTLGLLTTVA